MVQTWNLCLCVPLRLEMHLSALCISIFRGVLIRWVCFGFSWLPTYTVCAFILFFQLARNAPSRLVRQHFLFGHSLFWCNLLGFFVQSPIALIVCSPLIRVTTSSSKCTIPPLALAFSVCLVPILDALLVGPLYLPSCSHSLLASLVIVFLLARNAPSRLVRQHFLMGIPFPWLGCLLGSNGKHGRKLIRHL